MADTIQIDYSNMMKCCVGRQGYTVRQLEDFRPIAQKAFEDVQSKRGQGMQEWMTLATSQDEIVEQITSYVKKMSKKFDTFVLLGIGGSALGPIAAFNSLCHPYHNELPSHERKGMKFYCLDNVDPVKMNALMQIIDVEKTLFNVVTKSGATSETMSQYLIVEKILKERIGDNWTEHLVATTSKNKGNLIKLAKLNGFKTFYIPDGVGGRFSELCPVGLLPACAVGIDIALLLQGAAYMEKVCSRENMMENPSLLLAALSKLSMDTKHNICVCMPYSDNLRFISDWFCQLWAESLGKAVDLDGQKANVGQTPVKSLGVTDQHSQVQLYAEGPFDKVIMFLEVENFSNDVEIPQGCEQFDDVNFLCGHSLSELMNTELFATRYALSKAGRLNYTIKLPHINEHAIGQLLMLLMMQTAYTGALLNIDTYNQPGVEGGKNATYALFGRKGFEQQAKEIKKAKNQDFIV